MGFASAGYDVRAAVEIDPDAAAAYESNVGIKPLVVDIRNVKIRELRKLADLDSGECTLLFGCPPCQSFTILRRGASLSRLDRRRNSLPSQYVRLLAAMMPRHFVFENVPGMQDGRGASALKRLLGQVEELGYSYESGIIDAASYGVPQHRRRLVVVGSRVSTPRLPAASHGSSQGMKQLGTVRDAISDLLPLKSGEKDPTDAFHAARRHSELALKRLRAVPEGGGRHDLPEDLQLDCHKGHNGHYDIYGRMWWDRPAPTLTAGCTNVTRGRFAHPDQDRAITLREAMLLQSFPKAAIVQGTSDLMAQHIGNAVPSLLTERIGEIVEELEAASHRRPSMAA